VKCLVFLCALLLGLALAQQPTPHRDLRYQGVVGQTDWFTCGPAAVVTLLRY
jgi:predicted double-glycine peptidase